MSAVMIDPEILDAIESAISTRQPERAGGETRFLCPAHDDHTPSARWHQAKHAWHCDACSAGGGYRDLAERLGIPLPPPAGLSVAELAEAKGLSEGFLRGLGVADGVTGRRRTPCVDIPYDDGHGQVVALRKRLSLSGQTRFIWRRRDHPLPYGLGVLAEVREGAGNLIIVEGESDTWVCRQAGLPAVGIPGAAMMKPAWAHYFEGIARLFVWQEAGAGGRTFVEKVAAALPVVRVITAPDDAKDPAELWLRCGRDVGEFLGRMSRLTQSAADVAAVEAEASRHEAREALVDALPLLRSPDLLERIADAIRALGYAGDTRPPMIAYLALTSRLLRRPVNLAFVAPSGAGKNRAIDTALALMPPSAYYVEKAGSARALVYGDESYQHRTVIVSEADSIPEDGPAGSAIRSLAADNEMTYDTVEKDAGGRLVARRITKPGPTGLVTTSTRPLPHQFDTRTLTVTVADTPGQTRDVMRAHAATVNDLVVQPDVSELVAVQRWLELAGERRVIVPYAGVLAETVPADHVRMRRDFRQLLTMIEAVAMLHQHQRPRDPSGRVVASLEDYAHVRSLLNDVFQGVSNAGLTTHVRETVEAVQRLYAGQPLTKLAIADGLGLAKDTAWYRIGRALALGYLANDETRKGQPARIRPGDPLPDDRPALPTVREIERCVSDGVAVHSTVQPRAAAEPAPKPGGAVEDPVECRFQPPIQPLSGVIPDSSGVGEGEAVERLNALPDPVHTSGDEREVLKL